VPDGSDLEDHHADRVGDDVVQLARDPCPFLGDSDAGSRLALPFCPHGTCLRRLSLLRSGAQSEAHGPGDPELDGNKDELCGRGAGDVVNNRRNACEDDHQAGPCLPGVAQIPEQGGGRQPDEKQALDRRDQEAVDKGQRRREDPVGSRTAEGKPAAGEERQQQDRQRELDELDREILLAQQQRDLAEQDGDVDSWQDADRTILDYQERRATLAPPQPQGDAWTHEDAVWVQRRGDLHTPETEARFNQYYAYAKAKGLQPGTQAFRDGAELFLSPGLTDSQGRVIPHTVGKPLVPEGYQPQMTPDEAAQLAGVDAETYNRGVAELARRKAQGLYKDYGDK